MTRLSQPYSDCEDQTSSVLTNNVYAQHYPVQYSYMVSGDVRQLPSKRVIIVLGLASYVVQ